EMLGQFARVVAQAPVREVVRRVLPQKKNVVVVPEAVLSTGALGGLGRPHRTRPEHREVAELERGDAFLDVLVHQAGLGLLSEGGAVRALEIGVLYDADRRTRVPD